MEGQSIAFGCPIEREERRQWHEKFETFSSLLPNPTKGDRSSILEGGIIYIMKLRRTITELKKLVERKKSVKRHQKKVKVETMEKKPESDVEKKSKVTEVYVKIVNDEVMIKLVQKKMRNCLLFIFKVLDQLQLDLHHVNGGQIGDHYSFLLKTKKCEGAIICASAIADRVIEAADQHYMADLPIKLESVS